MNVTKEPSVSAIRSDLRVNACVVEPVDFACFIDAVKGLGMFWALVNERPPNGVR